MTRRASTEKMTGKSTVKKRKVIFLFAAAVILLLSGAESEETAQLSDIQVRFSVFTEKVPEWISDYAAESWDGIVTNREACSM